MRRFAFFVTALALAGLAHSVQAQTASLEITATSRGSSIIFEQLQALNFGEFVPADGGRIHVTPSGARSATNEIVLVGGHQAGRMRIADGTPNDWVEILHEDSIFLTPESGVGQQMEVKNFLIGGTEVGDLNETWGVMELTDQGEAEFTVGATLYVSPGQTPGLYTGEVTLTLVID